MSKRSGLEASAALLQAALLGALACALAAPLPARATEIEAAARRLVVQLAAGDFAGATAPFDARMKQALPPERLAGVWKQITEQAGDFEKVEGVRTETKESYSTVYVTCKFARAPLDAKVIFDHSGSVAGLLFAPAAAAEPEWSPPDYVHRDRFEDKPITVQSGRWHLPGMLSLPKGAGPFPGAVLVHGSGPHDLDETILGNKPFRDLAWGLASQGVAVLRYTKRTLLMAQEASPSIAGLTVRDETVDDARAAVALLARTPGVDSARVYVVGHSLGGMLAPRIAAGDPRVAGFVVLAGNARPMEVLALEQVRFLSERDGKIDTEEKEQIESIETAVRVIQSPALAETTVVDFLGARIGGAYWLDLRDYRPAEVAATLAIPMLVLRGERDYQVTAADFQAWQAALGGKRDARFKLYPGLNHLFVAGAGAPNPEEYAEPGHVAAEVVHDIARWIADPRAWR